MPSRLFNVRDAFGKPIYDKEFEPLSRGHSLRAKDDIEVVWYRKDFGTPGGWREIRGVQAAEVNTPFDLMTNASVRTKVRHVRAAWYLDELGKLERYRRQIYALTLTPFRRLHLGLLTVLEWPKDDSEPEGAQRPAFQRDTTRTYLVTSRDGLSVDLQHVYAHQPILPTGALQGDWNAGFKLPAAQIVSTDRQRTNLNPILTPTQPQTEM